MIIVSQQIHRWQTILLNPLILTTLQCYFSGWRCVFTVYVNVITKGGVLLGRIYFHQRFFPSFLSVCSQRRITTLPRLAAET